MLNNAELGTILAALRYYQKQGLGDPRMRPQEIQEIAEGDHGENVTLDDDGIDELCEKLNTTTMIDASAILLAINTQQAGEQSYLIGSAAPPADADPSNLYGLEELHAEWREEGPEEPESDSAFVEWLIEEKGWTRLGNVDSVTLQL